MPHARLLPSFLLLLLAVSTLDAHITLSFPPARHPPLDFLDTGRTHGPCGVPQTERSVYTTLQTERDYNFTFRLQYPHQGGFRLKLLDYLGNEVEQLAPTKAVDDPVASNSFDGLDDQSLEWKQVRIQSMCPNCTIVLERQALEWGPSYKFHSCAQVHVVQSFPNEQQRCLNGGTWKDDRCECRVGFTGEFCQHKGECNSDEDCQNGGKCVPNGIFPNINSCFCPNGYFGSKCQEKSVAAFSDDECFHHIDGKPASSSFKYGLFEERCFKKFELTDEDVLYSRIVKDQLELILDFETNSYVSLGWRPAHIPKTCRLFPDLSQTVGQHERGANTSGYLQSALDAPLHPMDCTDIMMASVLDGDFVYARDMYTRDRSTPLNDELLDGEQSLTSVYGIQRDGRTIVMFRRGIREIEPSDMPLGPGKIHVIHAKGQTQGHYKHSAPSALEKNRTAVRDFYKNDRFQYHGTANRGVHSLQFVTGGEMLRFKGPLMRNAGSSAESGVLERPSNGNALREQVLPRPAAVAPPPEGGITSLPLPTTTEAADGPRLSVGGDSNSSESPDAPENSSIDEQPKSEASRSTAALPLAFGLLTLRIALP